METLIDVLNNEIKKIESEEGNDDYHDGEIDGLIIAIRIIKGFLN